MSFKIKKNETVCAVLFLVVQIALITSCEKTYGQKKLITNENLGEFRKSGIRNPKISNDGKLIMYMTYSPQEGNYLKIERSDGKFKKQIPNVAEAYFASNGKVIFFSSANGVGVYNVNQDNINYVKEATAFYAPKQVNDKWLLYKDTLNNLVYLDLLNSRKTKYQIADNIIFNEQGTDFLLIRKGQISFAHVDNSPEKIIYEGVNPEHVSFNKSGNRIAFLTTGKNGNDLWFYNISNEKAEKVDLIGDSNFIIDGSELTWSEDGERLFIKLVCRDSMRPAPDIDLVTGKLDMWHYRDEFLKERQLLELNQKNRYSAVVSLSDQKIIQIENDQYKILFISKDYTKHKLTLVGEIFNEPERYWKLEKPRPLMLMSLLDGETRTIMPDLPLFVSNISISPDEKFVLWYNGDVRDYFSYEIASGKITNLTKGLKVDFSGTESIVNGLASSRTAISRIPIWFEKDSSFLVYDKFDIWKLDPYNKKRPLNITRGFGVKNEIVFRLVSNPLNPVVELKNNSLLLAALDKYKNNGFWRIDLNGRSNPVGCSKMEPFASFFPGLFNTDGEIPNLIKAKDKEAYLLTKQTANEYPNLWFTTDFKEYRKLTNLKPHEEFNWLTSELVKWKVPGVGETNGILYKPENFDSSKKYPVIFNYYEKRSNLLHHYLTPELAKCEINIPWYVSNGYLVFVPDMQYIPGKTSKGIINTVKSAVKELKRRSYVDASKMGLQGQSFGGYQTNVIIAGTTVFAAAQESAGMSDAISWFGSTGFNGKTLAFQYEMGQSNLLTTPWKNPKRFIENSPVLHVDRVKTPLLMQNSKVDGAVNFNQAIELFTSLRRLKKPVWLLQYDNQGHTLGDDDVVLDFNIRQQQFFDHYLKGKSAPLWMIEEIPSSKKSVTSGLRLDTLSRKP